TPDYGGPGIASAIAVVCATAAAYLSKLPAVKVDASALPTPPLVCRLLMGAQRRAAHGRKDRHWRQGDTRADRGHDECDGADRAGRISMDDLSAPSGRDGARRQLGGDRHLGGAGLRTRSLLPHGDFVQRVGPTLPRGGVWQRVLLRGESLHRPGE